MHSEMSAIDAKNVIGNAKCSYTRAFKTKSEKREIGSREFWNIIKQMMNKRKTAVHTIINGPEIISFFDR